MELLKPTRSHHSKEFRIQLLSDQCHFIAYLSKIAGIANAVQVTLWLSVTNLRCHDSIFPICQEKSTVSPSPSPSPPPSPSQLYSALTTLKSKSVTEWATVSMTDWLGHPLSCPGQLKMDSGTSPRQLTRWQKKQSSAKMRCGQDKILTFAKDDINTMFLVSQFKIAGEGSVQSIQRGLSNGNNWWVQIQRGVYTYLSIKHWGLILYSYDFQVYQSLFPLGESAKYAHLVFKTIDKDNTGSYFF